MIGHVLEKIKEVGLVNFLIGSVKRYKYKRLQKKYSFYEWNVSPIELREYAQWVVQYINKNLNNSGEIVDVGCGLGEIIRRIKSDKLYGYDLDEGSINAAKELDVNNRVVFEIGSFDKVGVGREIEYFLTLNFVHVNSEDYWRPYYTEICENNNVKYVVVDVVDNPKYKNKLDFSNILPDAYSMIKSQRGFISDREIQVWEKKQ